MIFKAKLEYFGYSFLESLTKNARQEKWSLDLTYCKKWDIAWVQRYRASFLNSIVTDCKGLVSIHHWAMGQSIGLHLWLSKAWTYNLHMCGWFMKMQNCYQPDRIFYTVVSNISYVSIPFFLQLFHVVRMKWIHKAIWCHDFGRANIENKIK